MRSSRFTLGGIAGVLIGLGLSAVVVACGHRDAGGSDAQDAAIPDTAATAANADVALANADWDPTSEAGRVLGAGLAEARETDRMVFLHSGAPWCSWCRRLEAWLIREDIHPIFSKDFVNVKIDIELMEGGTDVMHAFNGGYGGVPWLAILNPDGTVVIDSDHPDRGNIGSPIHDWEIEHWNTMMRTAAQRITEEEILYMASTLAEG